LVVTDNERLNKDQFAALASMLETDGKGHVTFKGMLDLYKLTYDEKGMKIGDETMWKDLKLFGFDCKLVHCGKYPPSKPVDAFSLLQGAKPSKRVRAVKEVKSDSKVARLESAVMPRSTSKEMHGAKSESIKKDVENPFFVRRVSKLPFEEKPGFRVSQNQIEVDPFFARRVKAKKINEIEIVDIDEDFCPPSTWTLLDFPLQSTSHVGWINSKTTDIQLLSAMKEQNETAFGSWTNDNAADYGCIKSQHSFQPPIRIYRVDLLQELPSAVCNPVYDHLKNSLHLMGQERRLDEYVRASWSSSNDLPWIDRYTEPYMEDLRSKMGSGFHDLYTWLNSFTEGKQIATDDYEPDSDSDFDDYFQDDTVWDRTKLIVGASGCSKTQAVHHCAEKLGFHVIELNSGMIRNGAYLKNSVGEATTSRVIGRQNGVLKRSLILIDDIDNVADDDKGFFSGIKSLVSTSRCPIVMTCNKLDSDIVEAFGSKVPTIHFGKPSMSDALGIIRCVCFSQGIEATSSQMELLITVNKLDIRRIINYLQFWCSSERECNVIDMTSPCKSSRADSFEPLDFKCVEFELAKVGESWNLEETDETGFDITMGECSLLRDIQTCIDKKCKTHAESERPLPVVMSVEPPIGTVAGGTVVSIYGTDLDCLGLDLVVTFNGEICRYVDIVSSTELSVVTPPWKGIKIVDNNANEFDKNDENKDSTMELRDDDFGKRKSREMVEMETVAQIENSDLEAELDDDFVPPSKRESKLIVEEEKAVDSIEDSDLEAELDDDFAPQPKRKLSKARVLASSRLWGCDVHVKYYHKGKIICSTDACLENRHNSFFEYTSAIPISNADTIPPAKPHTRKQFENVINIEEVKRSRESLLSMALLQETMSICDVISAPSIPVDNMTSRSVFRRTQPRSFSSFDMHLTTMECSARGPHISACLYELAASSFENPTTCSNIMQPRLHSDSKRFFESCCDVLHDGLPRFTRGSGYDCAIANGNRMSPLVSEFIPFLSIMAIAEHQRKKNESKRRFTHYFQRAQLYELREETERHVEEFQGLRDVKTTSCRHDDTFKFITEYERI